MCDYDLIENLFANLIRLSDGIFREEEVKEVNEFIDAGEYGLALQTYRDIAIEESKIITGEAFAVVHQLAEAMKLRDFASVQLCVPTNHEGN